MVKYKRLYGDIATVVLALSILATLGWKAAVASQITGIVWGFCTVKNAQLELRKQWQGD